MISISDVLESPQLNNQRAEREFRASRNLLSLVRLKKIKILRPEVKPLV